MTCDAQIPSSSTTKAYANVVSGFQMTLLWPMFHFASMFMSQMHLNVGMSMLCLVGKLEQKIIDSTLAFMSPELQAYPGFPHTLPVHSGYSHKRAHCPCMGAPGFRAPSCFWLLLAFGGRKRYVKARSLLLLCNVALTSLSTQPTKHVRSSMSSLEIVPPKCA